MNRRSLFRKLIGAVVGIKAAPAVAPSFAGFDPAFSGGDRSILSIMTPYMTEDGKLKYISDICSDATSAETANRFFPKLS